MKFEGENIVAENEKGELRFSPTLRSKWLINQTEKAKLNANFNYYIQQEKMNSRTNKSAEKRGLAGMWLLLTEFGVGTIMVL